MTKTPKWKGTSREGIQGLTKQFMQLYVPMSQQFKN